MGEMQINSSLWALTSIRSDEETLEFRHQEAKKRKTYETEVFVIVRAYYQRNDTDCQREARLKLYPNGNLAVDDIANALKLQGTLRVSQT
jgi:hypothetical protein